MSDPNRGDNWVSAISGDQFSARTGRNFGSDGGGMTQAGAAVGGAAIQGGMELAGGIMGAIQNKRAREESYQQGLDSIFKARRESEMRRAREERLRNQNLLYNQGAREVYLLDRTLKKQADDRAKAMSAIDRMNQLSGSNQMFRDTLVNLRGMEE